MGTGVKAGGYGASARFTEGSLHLAPSGAIAETMPRAYTTLSTAVSLASGTLRLQAIPLLAGTTITSISFVSIGGANTPTHWWFALLNSSRVYLRLTANQTTTAWAATTRKTVNLTSPYVTTYTGLHYVGVMMAATTPVTLIGMTSVTGAAGEVPILGGNSSTGLTTPGTSGTSEGDTAGALTAPTNMHWGWVS